MTNQTEYPPAAEWPTLNVLDGGGFDAYALPLSEALEGTTFTATLNPGAALELRFPAADRVAWRLSAGGDERGGEDAARVTENGDGIFLVSWVRGDDREQALTVVLDRGAGLVTVVESRLVGDDARGRAVEETFLHGRLDGGDGDPVTGEDARVADVSASAGATGGDAPLHGPSADLVGRRVQYVYGPGNAYEHVYLHEGAYSWQCLAGAEKGLADTDASTTIRIAEDVYLFSWREKVVPCDGIVLINFARHRSTGRIFGYDTDARSTNVIEMGARSTVLSETHHDPASWA